MFQKKLLLRAMALGELGYSVSHIAKCVDVKRSTINEWMNKARDHGLEASDVSEMSEEDLREMLFSATRLPGNYYQPDWIAILLESAKPTVSKNALWIRYCTEVPVGQTPMSRSTFFREIKRMEKTLTPAMQEIMISNSYAPGRKSMIDYSGDPVHYWVGGKMKAAQLFVAVVPRSSYSFAYATADQSRASHLKGLKNFFHWLGGVTDEVWCDNTRALVDKADKADPVINAEFANFCLQYGTVPYAVEPGQPRQKAPVENAVKLMQKKIIPELERRRLSSIDEINEKLVELLEEFNATPFSEMPQTNRKKMFDSEERQFLNDLPMFEYEPGYALKELKVSRQNQVRVLGRRIPVYYGYAGEAVQVFFNKETGHVRIHDRRTGEKIGERFIQQDSSIALPTTPDEMPEAFKRYVEDKKSLLVRIQRELGDEAQAVGRCLSRPNNSYSLRYLNAMIVESHKFTAEVFRELCQSLLTRTPVTFAKFKTAVIEAVREGRSIKPSRAMGKASVGSTMRGAEHYKRLAQSRQRQTTGTEESHGS